MDANKNLVSVVTPVFNGEDYIEDCIASVIGQTYQNWEYIILNNCSTDNTLNIVMKYARADNRIKIFTNDRFLSIMDNCNAVFEKMSKNSIYCKVVHADDMLLPECLEKMVELLNNNKNIGLVSSYRIQGGILKKVQPAIPYGVEFIKGSEICRYYLKNRVTDYHFTPPSAIMLRSDLIRKRNKFYKEASLAIDLESAFDVLQESDFGFVHQVLTYVRIHDDRVSFKLGSHSSMFIGNIYTQRKYGKLLLNPEEYKNSMKMHLNAYYRHLAYYLISKKERLRLFKHNKKELKTIEIKLNTKRLFIELACAFFAYIRKPFESLRKINNIRLRSD